MDRIDYEYVREKLNGAIDQVRKVEDKKDKVEIMKRVYGGHLEVIFDVMEGAIIRGSRGHRGDRGVGMDIMDKDRIQKSMQKVSMVGEFSVDDYAGFIDCIVNGLKDFYMKCVTWEGGKIEVKSINDINKFKDDVLKSCKKCIEAFDMEKKVDELIRYGYYFQDKDGKKDKRDSTMYAVQLPIHNKIVFVNSMKIIEKDDPENDGLEKDDPTKDNKRHIDTFDKKLKLLLILCIIKKVEERYSVDVEVSVLKKYHERIGILNGNISRVAGIGSNGKDNSLMTFINNNKKQLVVVNLLRDIAGVKWSSL